MYSINFLSIIFFFFFLFFASPQDIEERRALKADQSSPADNGVVEEPPHDAGDDLLNGREGAIDAEAALAKDPDVKPRRRDEDRRGSSRRKERRRADSSRDRVEQGGQHHQV